MENGNERKTATTIAIYYVEIVEKVKRKCLTSSSLMIHEFIFHGCRLSVNNNSSSLQRNMNINKSRRAMIFSK